MQNHFHLTEKLPMFWRNLVPTFSDWKCFTYPDWARMFLRNTLVLSYKTTWCHSPAESSKNLHHFLIIWSSGLWRCVIWWTAITFKGTGCLHLLGIRTHGITAQMPIILIFTTVRQKNIFTSNLSLRSGVWTCFLLELPDFNWRRRFVLETGKRRL
jgi:hypothetical protein